MIAVQRGIRNGVLRFGPACVSSRAELVSSTAVPALAAAQRIGEESRDLESAHLFAAGLAGAAAACFAVSAAGNPVSCEQRAGAATAPPTATVLQNLRVWLEQQGSKLTAVEIRSCMEQPAAGFGVYAAAPRPWIPRWFSAPRVLAEFPLSSAITAVSALNDTVLGPTYRRFIQKGQCDDRQLVMLYLLVERARGDGSPRAAYISALPTSFDTPLWYSAAELKLLEGTPLHAADAAQRRKLSETWRALEPLATEALSVATGGKPPRALTEDDFKWAYSAFWSRALLFPDPAVIAAELAAGKGAHAASPGAERLSATPLSEGIIPGLDYANHSFGAGARWTIFGAKTWDRDSAGASPQTVVLLEKGRPHRKGAEVRISYGDKSNEELLFTYGFAVPGNPNDVALLAPPLPPAVEVDDVLQMRLALCEELGVAPRAFLPLSALKKGRKAAEAELLDALPLFAVFSLTHDVLAALRTAQEADVGEMLKHALGESRRSALLLIVYMLELRKSELAKAVPAAGQKSGVSPQRLEAVAAYREGQKEIVAGYLDVAKGMLAALPPLPDAKKGQQKR